MSSDKLWIEDITILFDKDRFIEFFPKSSMSDSEKLNAITRCSLYISFILFIYNRSINSFFIALITMGIIYLMNIGYSKKVENHSVSEPISESISEPMVNSERSTKIENLDIQYTTEPTSAENYSDSSPESIHMDTSSKERFECEKPTNQNPFMNVLMTDYTEKSERPAACNQLDDPIIKNNIKDAFEHNLYSDVSDLFQKNNSQRQFYTTPNTQIPNEQTKFANWLYNTPKTCKEGNGNQCVANLPSLWNRGGGTDTSTTT